jgi:exopolysaccharide production protein ExoQ
VAHAQTHDSLRMPIDGAGTIITIILQAMAVTAPLVSINAPLFMAPLMLVGALAIVLTALRERRRIPVPGQPVLILLGIMVLWGIMSTRWSVYAMGSFMAALQLLALFAAGAVVVGSAVLLDGAEAARIRLALVIGILVTLAVYAVEMVLNSPIQSIFRDSLVGLEQIYSPFNRGLAVLVLLVPAAALALRRGGRLLLAIALLAATMAIVYVYYGTSVALGVACGIVAGTLSFLGRGPMTRLIGWLAAIMILASPFIAREAITPGLLDEVGKQVFNISIPHRFVIWRFAGTHALERPMTGWGLDAARSFPGGETTAPVTTRICQPPCTTQVEQLPLHPHNMALQWWLELGLPGAALGATILFWFFHLIPRVALDRIEEGLLVGQLTAAAMIAALSYGAWQSWWLSTLVITLALTTAAIRVMPSPTAAVGRQSL